MNLAKTKSNFPDNSSSSRETENKQKLVLTFPDKYTKRLNFKFIFSETLLSSCVFVTVKPWRCCLSVDIQTISPRVLLTHHDPQGEGDMDIGPTLNELPSHPRYREEDFIRS